MKRHDRGNYHIAGEGILTFDDHGNAAVIRPSSAADARKFRFSRLGPQAEPVDDAERMIFESVATAMTAEPPGGDIPFTRADRAGFDLPPDRHRIDPGRAAAGGHPGPAQ